MIFDIHKKEIIEKNFYLNNNSIQKIQTAYNNFLAVLHDEGQSLNLYDLSYSFNLYISFQLPDKLVKNPNFIKLIHEILSFLNYLLNFFLIKVIKDFCFDFENNFIGFLSNLGSIFLYDFKKLLEYFK